MPDIRNPRQSNASANYSLDRLPAASDLPAIL